VIETLERFTCGKRPGHNEDRVVVSDHHVVVVDGASDPTGLRVDGDTGGSWVAQVAAESLRHLPADTSAAQAVELASKAVRDGLARHAPDRLALGARRPFCHLVVYAPARRELWRLGDGHFRVGSQVHLGSKEVDDVAYRFRRAVLSAHLEAGVAIETLARTDPGTAAATALYAQQHRFQNLPAAAPFAYGCIDGTEVDPSHLEIVAVPIGVELVLASDGYFDLTGDLARAETSLAAAVATDPLSINEPLWRFGKGVQPGNLAPDDRSWVRLRSA
jgi:hypothetical protein